MTDTAEFSAAAMPSAVGSAEQQCSATQRQEQIWLAEQLVPGSSQHHILLTADIKGPLNLEALRRAFRFVINRHEALRTLVRRDHGELVQEVVASGAQFEIYDLEEIHPAQRVQRLAGIEADQLHRTFDMAGRPPIRTSVAILGMDEYRLFVGTHRIVADEESMRILARELVASYADYARSRQPALAGPPRGFSAIGSSPSRETPSDLQHWRAALAELPGPLELPFARQRGTATAVDTATATFRFPAQVVADLHALARSEGTSVDTAMLTALTVLLHRYTGSRDIVLGTWGAGRSEPAAAGVVGPITEPTVLRVRLPCGPTWRQALRLVRAAAEEAAAHPSVPFARLVALAGRAGEAAMHPLFQVFAAPQVAFEPVRTTDGVTFDFRWGGSDQAAYDLELRWSVDGGELLYRRDLYSDDHARTMGSHLALLLSQLATGPDTHLSNLSLLRQQEQQRILRDWNRTATDYPRDRAIQSLFEARAALAPQAPALRWEAFAVTYGELEERANQLAHYLRQLGVTLETSVGLYFGYTADWVIGALATLKAGGTYVPLDPAYPAGRLVAMSEDADVEVLLTHSDIAAALAYDGPKRVCLDMEAPAVAAMPTSRPEVDVEPDHLAYIMFTSGSTGRAKAIGVTHRNVVRTVCGTTYVEFRDVDSVGQASNISFDAATFEVWGALLNGSRLVGLRKADVLDPDRLKAQLFAHGIDVFFLPAALMKQIVGEKPDTFGSLRYFFSGGEQADLHTHRRIARHGPPGHMVNPYGPTETTVFAIVYRTNDMPATETYVPIGYPISNTTAYILDPYLQPVPVGVPGELFVGGDGVARGYVGQPDLTADKFIPDPWTDRPGARLYRTGDLARYRPDGMIDFLGRRDRQVKIRGFRVEPAEVEACLLDSGLLREASVQVGEDRGGDQVLVAYVVPDVADLDVEQLRDLVRARLPVYMVPSVYVPLACLPLNANGKLDVAALRTVRPVTGDEVAGAPPTATERRLQELWREVLGTSPGVHDNVFGLGAGSLQAGRVAARIHDEVGVATPYQLVFEHRTIAALAAAIDALRPPQAPSDAGSEAAAGAGLAAGAVPAAGEPGAGRGSTAEQVLAIWREVLEQPTLGPDDDFFLNGGHSLKVTRVVSRIKASLGRDVPVSLLFENRTAAAYAAAIEVLAAGELADAGSPVLARTADAEQDIDSLLDQIEALTGDGIDRSADPADPAD